MAKSCQNSALKTKYGVMKKHWLLLPFLALCCGLVTAPTFHMVAAEGEEPSPTIYYDETEDIHYEKVPVLVDYGALDEPTLYDCVYSTDPFFHPSDQYSHFLAKQSIGLALSAFHIDEYEEMDDQSPEDLGPEGTLTDYFYKRGFLDMRIDDYYKETSLYTVGSAIGHTNIEKNGEKASLVVVGIRGGNYKNEWQSNLTVGDGLYHQGFNEAATLVADRVFSYVAQHEFDYPLKVWISGYSRAGAITNLVAARLNESKVFDKSQIYAYTFAAPRPLWVNPYTPDPKTEYLTGYENIFNIVGASDFIPQFVPGEWGYRRYGIDKELPGAEFDSTFQGKYEVIQKELKKLGIDTYYNPALNLRVRMLYGLLLDLSGDVYGFTEYLQPFMLSVLQSKAANNLLILLRDSVAQWHREHPELSPKIDEVIDFALEILAPLLSGGSYVEGQQSSSHSAVYRLAHEHFPELYLYMLYHLTPEELFNTASEFAYIAATGGTLSVKIGENEVVRIKDGKQTVTEYGKGQKIQFAVWKENDKTVLALPYDRMYTVNYSLEPGETASYFVLPYGRVYSSRLSKFTVNGVSTGGTLLSLGTEGITYEGVSSSSAPSEFIHYLGIEHGPLPYRVYIFLVGLAIGLLMVAVLWLLVFIHSRITKLKMRPIPIAIISAFILAAVEGEVAFWFFSDLVYVGAICKTVAALCLLTLYFLGKKIRMFKAPHKTILPFLILAFAGEVLLSVFYPVGVGLIALGFAHLCYYYLRKKRLDAKHWFFFGVLLVIMVGLMALLLNPLGLEDILTIVLIASAILVSICSTMEGGVKQTAGFILLVASVCLGLFLHPSFAFVGSVAFVGAFAIGMILHVSYFDLPEEKEESLALLPKEEMAA